MSYASNTSVDASRTQAEIQSTLLRFGAQGFMSGQQILPSGEEVATIAFQYNGLLVRFTMEMPKRDEKRFTHTPERGTRRTTAAAIKAWEQACKSKWRSLLLAIKAKLVAIEEGISTVEQEFLAWVVMPNQQAFGEYVLPKIQRAIEQGGMPALPFGGKEVDHDS